MEWRKVKNIIILILLLVNGFLLVIVGSRVGEVRRYERSALEQAVRVLETNGIRVNEQAVTAAEGLSSQAVERSAGAETEMAGGLLGEAVTVRNQGGGMYTYYGSRGIVNFRTGGQFDLRPEEDARWKGTDPEALARSLLSEMKIEGEITETALNDGTGTVTVRQLWQGVPVFSCWMVFTFRENVLTSLSGTVLAPGESSVENDRLLTLPSALLAFQDGILSGGDVCSAVESMKPGYRMVQSFRGTLWLEPVWLISGNTADYYMDAVTGELSRLTGE